MCSMQDLIIRSSACIISLFVFVRRAQDGSTKKPERKLKRLPQRFLMGMTLHLMKGRATSRRIARTARAPVVLIRPDAALADLDRRLRQRLRAGIEMLRPGGGATALLPLLLVLAVVRPPGRTGGPATILRRNCGALEAKTPLSASFACASS
jgi:hypothetical protein